MTTDRTHKTRLDHGGRGRRNTVEWVQPPALHRPQPAPPPKGLFAFRNMVRGTIGNSSLVVRFTEPVTELHQKQLYEAMHAWMVAQKLIAENNGQPPSREQIEARFKQEVAK